VYIRWKVEEMDLEAAKISTLTIKEVDIEDQVKEHIFLTVHQTHKR
jgi:hypothetical protein